MTQKKVIIFIPSIEGFGVEKNLFYIVNFFSKRINNVTIITSSKLYKKKFDKKIKFLSLNHNLFFFKGRIAKYFFCSLILFREIIKNPRSIIFSFQSNLIAILIAKILGSTVVIRLNTSIKIFEKRIFIKFLAKFFYSLANRVIVNSLEFKSELKRKFNVRSVCIYNPLNKNEILIKSKIKCKSIFNIPKAIKIITVGRFVFQKNHFLLLRTIEKLVREKKIMVELVIVGEGFLKNKYIEFIKKNKLEKYIKILDYTKNPYNLIQQSDIFILTSNFEGLPNVLLEAISLNKFVISSDCRTGPKEILLNGKGGLLFKTGDLQDLVNKIIFYKQNKKTCRSLKKIAKKNLIKFDYTNNLKRYLFEIQKFY